MFILYDCSSNKKQFKIIPMSILLYIVPNIYPVYIATKLFTNLHIVMFQLTYH
jgi:hypothetical protein